MAASEPKIDNFFLPEDIIVASTGFSVDIGGSMAKIVFRSNKEYKDAKFIGEKDPRCPPGMGPLHSVQFPRAETDRYCAFLKENCDIIPGGVVYATGIGGSQYQTKLEGLGIKLEMLSEFKCFVISLNILLEKYVKEDWLEPLNLTGLHEGVEHLKYIKLMQDMAADRPLMTDEVFNSTFRSQVDAYAQRCEDNRKHLAGVTYPYLMVMCGSAFALVKVDKDGSSDMVAVNMISGRFFLGMSAILSNEKDYPTLIRMCEEYDGSSVDIRGQDCKSANPEEQGDLYSKIDPKARVFPFGKGHDIEPGTAVKGDLISSLNQTVCDNLALSVFHVCREHGLKDAYFCGGFVSQEVARRHITKGLTWRNLSVPSGTRIHVDFVSNSSHLGSLGAYVYAYHG